MPEKSLKNVNWDFWDSVYTPRGKVFFEGSAILTDLLRSGKKVQYWASINRETQVFIPGRLTFYIQEISKLFKEASSQCPKPLEHKL
jgi:hypothetical protein